MNVWQVLFVAAWMGQADLGGAQVKRPVTTPASRQLQGINPKEANDLISKLEDAQRRLKTGELVSFELLAGSIASYDKTKVSPREAFLSVPFKSVWKVTRDPSDNELWQPYNLAYAPVGLGQLYWDIEVVLGVNGDVERVLMIYRPPAPF